MTPLLALVAGAFVFLRLPLDSAPAYRPTAPGQAPAVATAPARASAAAPPADVPIVAAEPRVRATRPAPSPPPQGPYHHHPPSSAILQPLAAHDAPVAELLETRLLELEELGLVEATTDVLYLLGAEQQAAAQYAVAAGFYEAFAAQSICDVTCAEQAPALENAVVLHQATGDIAGVLRSADLFEERFANSHPRAATRVALTAAAMDGPGGPQRLERLTRRRLPPAEAIQSTVALAKRLLGTDPSRARRAFRRADRLWHRSGGDWMVTSPGLEPTAWAAELGRTREAVAEARFQEAERRYRAATRRGTAPAGGAAGRGTGRSLGSRKAAALARAPHGGHRASGASPRSGR